MSSDSSLRKGFVLTELKGMATGAAIKKTTSKTRDHTGRHRTTWNENTHTHRKGRPNVYIYAFPDISEASAGTVVA